MKYHNEDGTVDQFAVQQALWGDMELYLAIIHMNQEYLEEGWALAESHYGWSL